MIRRLLCPTGACLIYLAVAALVIGGLAWVTVASLGVEQAHREATARANRLNKERLALWRLDGQLLPALGLESSRPFSHYMANAAYPTVDLEQIEPAFNVVRLPSPLLSAELPAWMKLHFQFDPETGWSSPQVIPADLAARCRAEPLNLHIPNVTPERELLLAKLQERFPMDTVSRLLGERDLAVPQDRPFLFPFALSDETSTAKPSRAYINDEIQSNNGVADPGAGVEFPPLTTPKAGLRVPLNPPPAAPSPVTTPPAPITTVDVSGATATPSGPPVAAMIPKSQQDAIQQIAPNPRPAGSDAKEDRSSGRGLFDLQNRQNLPAETLARVITTENAQNGLGGYGGIQSSSRAGKEAQFHAPYPNAFNKQQQDKAVDSNQLTRNNRLTLDRIPPALDIPDLRLQMERELAEGRSDKRRADEKAKDAATADRKSASKDPLSEGEVVRNREPEAKMAKKAEQRDIDNGIASVAGGNASVPKGAGFGGNLGGGVSAMKSAVAKPTAGMAPGAAAPPMPAKPGEAGAVAMATPARGMLLDKAVEEPGRGFLGDVPAGERKAAPPVRPMAVHLGSLRAQWLTGADGQDELVLVRAARLEHKTVYQGVLLDWPRLQKDLGQKVADMFPSAALTPVKATDEPSPERAMSALPAQLDPGTDAELPPAGWTPLRMGLAIAWTAAFIALIAVGVGGSALVNLSERRIRFVSAVTHELRTPLTSLRLYLDMLTSGMITEEDKKREYLNTLAAESDRLNRLVENVLDFARLEKRSVQMHIQATPVDAVLNEVRDTWADRCITEGKELIVISTVPAECTVRTDLRVAAQVLGNFIDNARKYTRSAEDGRIWVWAKPGERGRIVLEVEDRGPGVLPRDRGSLFRPFRRGSNADTQAGGAGLGLALAKQWAEIIGGKLSYRPAEGGVGACFRLELPAT